jgi:heat shock protein HslJ
MFASSVRVAAAGLVAALALTACEAGEPRSESYGVGRTPADLAELGGGVWVANHILDPDTSIVPGSQIEVRFKNDSVAVTAGCNTLFGPASIDGTELAVSGLASTQKACDDDLSQQDAWLSDFLSSNPTIEVLANDLWLSQGEDTVIHLTRD